MNFLSIINRSSVQDSNATESHTISGRTKGGLFNRVEEWAFSYIPVLCMSTVQGTKAYKKASKKHTIYNLYNTKAYKSILEYNKSIQKHTKFTYNTYKKAYKSIQKHTKVYKKYTID